MEIWGRCYYYYRVARVAGGLAPQQRPAQRARGERLARVRVRVRVRVRLSLVPCCYHKVGSEQYSNPNP